ncbi:sugar transporter SWEET1 [Ischnura elegans]|uniref:sugar transporter SWEET1 n=1 Tax=Ischnura elegans TaxID=197161 RepID=UPI001ED878B7|nr:sugar transporter SWEET1 [Ischnura elegans]
MGDFKSALATTASISTILQFLSGVLICRKIVRKGTCGDTSCFPFVAGFASCSLWLRYGCLIEDVSLIVVNCVGAFLQLSYVFIYLLYSPKKTTILRQLGAVTLVLFLTLAYVHYESDPHIARTRMGLICCSMTLLFFVAPFSVLTQVIRTKSSESLPFPLIVTTFVVSCQWFTYGVLLNDQFVQIPNAFGCILSALQLSLFVIYPKSNITKSEKWSTKDIPPRIL